MSQKTVLLFINHAPHGSIFCIEGLRAAMGVISTTDEHNVIVVFVGDGAYATLAGTDRSGAARFITTLAEWGYGLNVDKESLAERSVRDDEVAPDVKIIPRSELLISLNAADFTIDF